MHPVAVLIHRRIQGEKDSERLALVIGGGAMRGAVAGGMLGVLEEIGADRVFDHIYGASAGATSGAVFLARQCSEIFPVLLTRLTKREFIRVTPRGIRLNIPFVYRKLLREVAPLDVARVRAHKAVLHCAVTHAETGEARWFTNHDAEDVLTVLEASAAIPSFYNIPVEIAGEKYLDGGIAAPLAVARAVEDGATRVLVLATVPARYRAVNRHPMIERWARRRVRIFGAGFRHAFENRYHVFNESLALAFGRAMPSRPISLCAIAPQILVGWSERRRKRLMKAIEEGKKAMEKALGQQSMIRMQKQDTRRT